MRSFVIVALALACCGSVRAEGPATQDYDWKAWRALPVQDGGRQKPLDSLARETWRMIANRTRFVDPETGQKLDATGLYLVLLLDWQGWDKPLTPHHMPGNAMPGAGVCTATGQAAARQPDRWDRCDLILVESPALRKTLAMPADQKYISPLALSKAEFRDADSPPTPFLSWTQKLAMRQGRAPSPLERQALDLAARLRAYHEHRSGRRLEIAPLPGSEDKQWASLSLLMRAALDDKMDPSGGLRQLKDKFQKVRQAYLAKSPEAFRDASAAFLGAMHELGPQLGEYPAQEKISLEVAYNHWVPFRFAWVLMLVACVGALLSVATGRSVFYLGAMASFLASVAAMLIGFGLRVAISGRAPVTNMYESVIYVALGTAVFGLILTVVYRSRILLAAAAAISTLALVLADNCPIALDPSIQPLTAILRDNYWLIVHVLTVTASYAAFALAWIIGNIALGYYLAGSKDRATLDALARVTYWTLLVGVLLLEVGTVLGAMWADNSWGRFWSWDRKEVWALVSLLIYLAVLHARTTGWVGNRALAALSAVSFSLVLMAWYGVNLMGEGSLHSYGLTGGAGQASLTAILLSVQFFYVLAAISRIQPGEPRGAVARA
jgi:ABC-type transport system involved in cytochrome c biogenesis permease subunit